MNHKKLPKHFFHPMHFPYFWDELEDEWSFPMEESGLSVYEDENMVYVEAALPGLSHEHIDITFDKGTLWIKGEKEEEESGKKHKYYRKAANSFAYRVALPGNVDESQEPEAFYENGIMKIVFHKKKEYHPKKIQIKKKS